MTIEEIINIDSIEELHKIIIHHEVEIDKLKAQLDLLQHENKSLNGFYIRQKEFNEDHFFINRNDIIEWSKCAIRLKSNSKDESEFDKIIADCSLIKKIDEIVNSKEKSLIYHGYDR